MTGLGVFRAVCVSGMMMIATSALGSGFALTEQSGYELGMANADAAVDTNSPAGQFNNAATLSNLRGNAVTLVSTILNDNTSFRNGNSIAAFGQTLGNTGGNVGHTHFIPSDYMAFYLSSRIKAGLVINSPFGLSLDYKWGSAARFQALHSSVETINVNPNISLALGSGFSIGAGVSYQKVNAELSSAVNYSAIIGANVPAFVAANIITPSQVPSFLRDTAGLEGVSDIRGGDHAFGYNVGVMYISQNRKVEMGLSYRSAITHIIRGTATFTAPNTSIAAAEMLIRTVTTSAPLEDGDVSLRMKLPASANISMKVSTSDDSRIFADLMWTQWSNIQQLNIVRTNGVILSSTPEYWRNTLRESIGGEIDLSSRWMARGGIAYDDTPVPDSTRNPRLPDNPREWLSMGLSWKVSKNIDVDGGYVFIYEKPAPLHSDGGNTDAYGLIDGEQHTRVNIASVQLTMFF